jgi:hypothetical protein
MSETAEGGPNTVKQVVIENPVINSPFLEPTRHFRSTDEGITNEVIDGRRSSSYFVPIARPRKKGQKQLEFDTEWTQDRTEENKKDKGAKVSAARTLWVRAVNNNGGFGRWAFIEVADLRDAQNAIRG